MKPGHITATLILVLLSIFAVFVFGCDSRLLIEAPPPDFSQPEQVEQPRQPEQVEQPGRSEQPEQPRQPEQPEQPEQPLQPEQPGQPEQPQQPALLGQMVQSGQPEQPGQPEDDLHLKVSFLFFSDTQADPETGDYSELVRMLELAIRQAEPSLAIFGGDTVNDGGDAAEWAEFGETAASKLKGLTTAAAPGNHDGNPLLAAQFDYPQSAPSGQGEGYFYSFDIGLVHFIMLDSNIMGAANDRDVKWLQNDLKSKESERATWRIAVMHHPMWPVAENPKDAARAETIRLHFLPLLEEYRVDLILCGHQHVYARCLPMSGGKTAPEHSGIVQVMAASGGKDTYAAADREYISVIADAPNYLHIIADEDSLTITARRADGEPFDTLILDRK